MKYLVDDYRLTNIADSIRSKTGGSDTLTLEEMPTAIEGIQTGGGGSDLDALIDGSITEIKSDATKVRDYAFYSCTKLEKAIFPSASAVGQYSFRGCSLLSYVEMPLLTTIQNYGFAYCKNLPRVLFPNLTSLGGDAFYNCNKLEFADIGSISSISSATFSSCSALKTVVIRKTTLVSLSNTNAFQGCYHILGTYNATHNPNTLKDGYFYVPRDLVESYKSATNWSTYATQFRALEDYTVDGTITGELDESKI